MDKLEHFRNVVENVLTDLTRVPYAYGQIQLETVFDRAQDRYLLLTVGWDGDRRVHGSLVHIDIVAGKVWIQRDGTEPGVAPELVQAGIPKSDIVLAFHPPALRKHTEYAVA